VSWGHLQETFVSLFVLQDGQAVDGHRDFITGAGFTEHTVFISWLLDKNGWLTPLPKGPVNSQPGKKRPKAKAKRSARTKAMLAPPQPREVVGGKKGSKELLVFPRDVLPGRPSNADEPAFLHSFLWLEGSRWYVHGPCNKRTPLSQEKGLWDFLSPTLFGLVQRQQEAEDLGFSGKDICSSVRYLAKMI